MENPNIWLRFTSSEYGRRAAIQDGLARAGIGIESFYPESDLPGIVCCSETSMDEAAALVSQTPSVDRHRVVAIYTTVAQSTRGQAWRLLRAGAADVIYWREDGSTARQLKRKLERWSAVDQLVDDATLSESLVGEGCKWRTLLHKVVEAARFSQSPILLVGESGTGKECLARLIHAVEKSTRQCETQMVTVDCATLVPELSGSELFGHERGAFTGAITQREGAFALANHGTLVLDEIGELAPAMQAQLLRAIQERTYKRVGGNAWQTTDFRLVCATNRNLENLVGNGQFRLDLYHRIAAHVFRTPSLRERREDILPLAMHFLSEEFGGEQVELDSPVRDWLLSREFSGNVRELRNLMLRVAHRHAQPGPVTVGDIPDEDRPQGDDPGPAWPDDLLQLSMARAVGTGISLREITQTAAETAIRLAIEMERSLPKAARRLGVTDRALQLRRAAKRLNE